MKHIVVLVLMVLPMPFIDAQTESCASYNNWSITPHLYNDSISNQSKVCFWQNYWWVDCCEGDSTTTFLFPDTLIACLQLIAGTELWEREMFAQDKGTCRVISNLYFKLGEGTNSYNIVNSENSERILLLDSTIDLNVAFDFYEQTNEGLLFIAIKKIPMREILSSKNVFTNTWREVIQWGDGRAHMLNQVIIETVINDLNGVTRRRFEFSLPVNGAYCGPDIMQMGE